MRKKNVMWATVDRRAVWKLAHVSSARTKARMISAGFHCHGLLLRGLARHGDSHYTHALPDDFHLRGDHLTTLGVCEVF